MSDWQDPFAEDEAARERAARRAERERRRGEEDARESLGDRVREGLNEDGAPPPARHPPAATPPAAEPPAALPPSAVAGPSAPAEPEPPTEQYVPPPVAPPPRHPSSGAAHGRRVAALVALGLLIAIVAALGTIISRDGDDDAPAADAPKAKKTIEFVVPEGLDRTQIADVAKKEGLKGDYLKATQSFKGFDPAEYGAEGAENLEGFLFPATYELFKGATVEDLVAKQLEAFEANLAEVDVKGAKGRGYTPYELVIIASMVEREIADMPSVSVVEFDSLLMDFAERAGATLILRGLRAVADFEYEYQMAGMNQQLNDRIETVFLMADVCLQPIASRLVKEIARYGGAIDKFVTPAVATDVALRLKRD